VFPDINFDGAKWDHLFSSKHTFVKQDIVH
jgi:hypothetical protein